MLAASFGRYRCWTSSLPQRLTALITSVFCTSTSTPIEGSTQASASTARTEWKNVRAAPAEALGDLDAHDAEGKELVDEGPRDLGVFVHVADQRSDLAVGEFEDTVAKKRFVLGQPRQGRGGHAERVGTVFYGVCHG